jgi:hypothetical protein
LRLRMISMRHRAIHIIAHKSPTITTAKPIAKSTYKRMARPIRLMAKPCQSGSYEGSIRVPSTAF